MAGFTVDGKSSVSYACLIAWGGFQYSSIDNRNGENFNKTMFILHICNMYYVLCILHICIIYFEH